MKLPIERLEKNKKKKLSQRKWLHVKIVKQLKTELDLRGYRYEDALIELDQYLDQAVLSNYEQVISFMVKVQVHFKRCTTTFEKA